MKIKPQSRTIFKVIAVFAFLFGLLTIKTGGSVLFGPEAVRMAAGDTVSFVLWFNVVAGFFYIFASFGLWSGKLWAIKLAGLIALLTAIIFLALGLYITGGGLYEIRTLAAMTLRFAVWTSIYFYARRRLPG